MKHIFFSLLTLTFSLMAVAQQEAPFRQEIEAFTQQDSINPPPSDVVLFVGSSSFRKWGDLSKVFPQYKVLNRGFGGSQFSDVIRYEDELIARYDPAAILIYEGDNDIAAGKTVLEVMRDASELLDIIRNHHPDVPVIFVSPKPSPSRWELKEQYITINNALKGWTSKEAGIFFIDVWDRMLDANGEPDEALFVEDMLHMNEKGYAIWKREIGGFLSMIIQ